MSGVHGLKTAKVVSFTFSTHKECGGARWGTWDKDINMEARVVVHGRKTNLPFLFFLRSSYAFHP